MLTRRFSSPVARFTILAIAVLASSTRAQGVPSDTVRFSTVSVGGIHTCGVATGGVAYCWGWNSRGQLGDGTSGGERAHPARVAGDVRFAAVSAGDRYTCGLTPAGAAYCWGLNGWGQLGDGTTTDQSSPVRVAGGLTFAAVSAGDFHTCGVTAAGGAYCWGANDNGQLGDGTMTGPEMCRFAFFPDNPQVPCSTVPTQVVPGGRAVAAAAPLGEKEAEHVAAMKSDLRNLVVAEEVFFADSVKCSSRIGPGGVDLRLREGNILLS